MQTRTILLSAIALAGTAFSPAVAGTSTGVMPVSATVLNNCTVAATPMAFGSLSSVGAVNIDTAATVNLVCTPNATYTVALDHGANASGSVRRMKNPISGEFLPYSITTDAARTQAWGNTSGVDTVGGTATTGLVSITAYGRVPVGAQPVSAGAYADTVTVTVNF